MLKLRTKIEAISLVSLLVVLSFSSAWAVTRNIQSNKETISGGTYFLNGNYDWINNSHFNLSKKIQNSKGHLYNVSARNLQLAIWDLNGTGGFVDMPVGIIPTADTSITMLKGNITIRGQGSNVTVFTAPTTAKDVFTLGNNCTLLDFKIKGTPNIATPVSIGNKNCRIENIIIEGGGGFYAIKVLSNNTVIKNVRIENMHDFADGWAAAINVNSTRSFNVFIDNFYINDCDRGIEIENGANHVYVQNGFVNDVPAQGTSPLYSVGCHGHAALGYAKDISFKNININNSAGFAADNHCKNVVFDSMHVERMVYDECIIGDESHSVVNSYFNGYYMSGVGSLLSITYTGGKVSNCYFDNVSEYNGVYVNDADYATIDKCTFVANSTAGDYAIRVTGAGGCRYLTITNNKLLGNYDGTYAMDLRYIYNGTIFNNFINVDGIRVYGEVQNVTFMRNYIEGVLSLTAGSKVYLIDNDFRGTSISDSSSNTVYRDNIGYRTENWGNTSVANNGTINHGLAVTPIVVLLTSNYANLTFMCMKKSSTTFTVIIRDINTHTTPSGSYYVMWYAKV